MDNPLFGKYVIGNNDSLRHNNPTVRKQGEALFKMFYVQFGDVMLTKLVQQKPQMVSKLTTESQKEAAESKNASNDPAAMTSSSFGATEETKAQLDQ